MQGQAADKYERSDEPEKEALLKARVRALEASLKEAGIFELFDEPRMISMRLPNRPHPVACSFLQDLHDCRSIVFDLQIGGLSSRALAIAGQTTIAEADIIGTTLTFAPLVPPKEIPGEGSAMTAAERQSLEDLYQQHKEQGESSGRHPGKAPHQPDVEELETLAFAYEGISAAFVATDLAPCDVWEAPRRVLEIRVEGTSEDLLLGKAPSVTWDYVPFEPIKMAPSPTARFDRSLRRKPMHGKRSWILHMIPMNVSCGPDRNTIQSLFVLDARAGDIVAQGAAVDGTADAIGRCLGEIIEEVGYRPGSAITTSPRLDDMLGETLQGLGVRYTKRRRLKASDPRVQALEEFMRWAQPNMMADMFVEGVVDLTGPGGAER